MDDISITLEHVDLLNGLNGLGVQLLEGSLELLVIVGVSRGRTLDLASGSSLAACHRDQSPTPPSSVSIIKTYQFAS
jgi:hypothetical protein